MHVTVCILVRRALLKYYIYFPISISINCFFFLHSFYLELPHTWASWRRLNLQGSGAMGIIWTISSGERERERERESECVKEGEREKYIYTHQFTCTQQIKTETCATSTETHRNTHSNTGYLEHRVRTLVSL